jgi:uncharacterized membrane protein YuzA (DUF378 family)
MNVATTTTAEMSPGTLKAIKIALALAILGAINWGLVGFFNWNLVDAIFGGGAHEDTSGVSRVIYAIVGLAGLAALPLLKAMPTLRHGDALPHSPR